MQDIIYPHDLAAKLGIDIQSTYKILEKKEIEGDLTSMLSARCDHCKRWQNTIWDAFWHVPNDLVCSYCGRSIRNPEDIYVVFVRRKKGGEN